MSSEFLILHGGFHGLKKALKRNLLFFLAFLLGSEYNENVVLRRLSLMR